MANTGQATARMAALEAANDQATRNSAAREASHPPRVKSRVARLLLGAASAAGPMLANAGVTLYEDDDRFVAIAGRIQVQYMNVDPETDGAERTDDLFFRRLRLAVEGSLTEDVSGIWQVDLGSNANDAEVKDAYIEYSGFRFGDIVVGNHYVPFSRENLTSSKRQQLVERTFVGDHDFGVPDRQIGISVSGGNEAIRYAVGGYQAGIDGSTTRLDFESPVSQIDDDDNVYNGHLIGGRIDFTPLGQLDFAQGAFGSETLLGVGINAFGWSNDDDVSDPDGDGIGDEYDEVIGYGIDAAFRSGGFSADAAYQVFEADSIDPTVTDGLIVDGKAELDSDLLKAGYMVVPGKLEVVASYSALDCEAFDETDTRVAVGLNWFIEGHDDKIQLTVERGSDVIATEGNTERGDDQNLVLLQFQHVL